MYYLIKPIVSLAWLARTLVLAALILLVFGIFSPNLDSPSQESVVLKAINPVVKPVQAHLLGLTRKYLFATYKGKDVAHYVAPGAAFILFMLLNSLYAALQDRSLYYRTRKETADLQKRAQASQSESAIKNTDKLSSKLEEIGAAPRGDRKKLLKEFVRLKQQLESMGRDLSFLSIDVVDSTGMKLNEDTYVVSNDFAEYRVFVETRINAHGCIKSTWTPDGLMACFGKLEDSIRAAQSILRDLAEFNRKTKTMKRDFVVRCGINAGHVFFDDTLPLEQISDRVIDVAGHMQKHAEPNTIYIAKQIVKPVDVMVGFNKTDAEIDGFSAYKWEEKSTGTATPT